ncbi:MAG: DMT family transporter [Polyangiaceae bacterium]
MSVAPSPADLTPVPNTASEHASSSPFFARFERSGLAWMMAANVLFAIMTLAARSASRTASFATVGATRAFVGGLVALLVGLRTGRSLRVRTRGLSWARSLLGTGSMIATFYALAQIDLPVGDAVTLFATAPILIALLAPVVLGERTDRRLWGALLVAFGGVALIAGPHFSGGSKGALSALVAAGFSALAMLFLRRMRGGKSPESAEAIALHFAIVAFLVLSALNLVWFSMPTPRDMGLLVIAGVAGGSAQLAMTRAYALTEAARLGAVSYLGTVFSFVGSILLLGERPVWSQIAGAGLVIGAGIALALGSRRASS